MACSHGIHESGEDHAECLASELSITRAKLLEARAEVASAKAYGERYYELYMAGEGTRTLTVDQNIALRSTVARQEAEYTALARKVSAKFCKEGMVGCTCCGEPHVQGVGQVDQAASQEFKGRK